MTISSNNSIGIVTEVSRPMVLGLTGGTALDLLKIIYTVLFFYLFDV